MNLRPLTRDEANEFISSHHRHAGPVVGARFCIGAESDGMLVAVAVVGRPTARMLNDGYTAELTRLCTSPDAPRFTCSMLYRASWRAWVAMGGRKLVTYTLKTESGSSLRGAGFRVVGEARAKTWDTPSRHREWQPIQGQQKFRWELTT